jgi:hypothetical protein
MYFLGSAFGTSTDTAKTSVTTSTNPTSAIAEEAFLVGDPIATGERHSFFSTGIRNRETQPSQGTGPAHARLRVLFWKLRPRFTERGLISRARRRLSPPIARPRHRRLGIASAFFSIAQRTFSRSKRMIRQI